MLGLRFTPFSGFDFCDFVTLAITGIGFMAIVEAYFAGQ